MAQPTAQTSSTALPKDLQVAQHAAQLLDSAFVVPVLGIRVGWDAILGMVPGGGDVLGGLMSAALLLTALRHRVPLRVVGRMVLNILLDVGLGTVPVVGDVVDVFIKNNVRNVELLMEHRNQNLPPRELPAVVTVLVTGATVTVALLGMAVSWLVYLALSGVWAALGN